MGRGLQVERVEGKTSAKPSLPLPTPSTSSLSPFLPPPYLSLPPLLVLPPPPFHLQGQVAVLTAQCHQPPQLRGECSQTTLMPRGLEGGGGT